MLIRVRSAGEYRIVPFPADRRAIDIGDYYSDYRKIGEELGWKPKVGLEEGLRATLGFYREHHAHYWESRRPRRARQVRSGLAAMVIVQLAVLQIAS